MKYLLITLLFVISFYSSFGQVPDMEMELEDISMEEPEPSQKAKGEVYGHFYRNGKFGFKITGVKDKEPEFDLIKSANGSFIVKKGGKFALFNKRAEIVIPFKYDSITYFKRNLDAFKIWKKKKIGILNAKGEVVIPFKKRDISFISYDYSVFVAVDEQGTKQLRLRNGKPFPYAYDFANVLRNGILISKDGKYGFVSNGQLTIPLEYDEINVGRKARSRKKDNIITWNSHLGVNQMLVSKGGKFGLISSTGEVIVPVDCDKIKYDKLRRFYYLTKDRKQGAYLPGRKKFIPIEYDRIYLDGTRYITLTKDRKQGILNYNLETIVPFEYDKVRLMGSNKGFRVIKNKKQGWLDKNGKELIPVQYDKIDDFYQSGFSGFYKVTMGDSTGVIDASGKVIVPVIYKYVFIEEQFFTGMSEEKKLGLINKQGKVVLPNEYDYINSTVTKGSKVIEIRKGDKKGLIGENEKIVLPVNNKTINYLHNSELLFNPRTSNKGAYLHIVNEKGKSAIFDEYTMQLVVPFAYDNILQKFETSEVTYFIAQKGKKYGVIDHKNTVIVPFEYSHLSFDQLPNGTYKKNLSGFYLPAAQRGKYGIISMNNKVVVPFQYNDLARISFDGYFKAQKGKQYVILSPTGKELKGGPFDEVELFEDEWALTFTNGKMSPFHKIKGVENFEKPMQPHDGYTTFEELKHALIKAFNSEDDSELRVFAKKIAPSEHMMYYLEMAFKNRSDFRYMNSDHIVNRYYEELLKFKYREWRWKDFYRRSNLTETKDYTLWKRGLVTNSRTRNHAFGNVKTLEKFLRNSMKINGYWISSYFMSRRFRR